jgi:phage shock protein A
MMSFMRRVVRLIRQKINAAFHRWEDPVEILDLLDAEYVRDLTKMRRHIAEVFGAEKRLEFELVRVRMQEQRSEIERAYENVCEQRKELQAIAGEMQARLEALRVRRHTARAETAACKALIAAREWMLPLSSAGLAREESLDQAREALFTLRCRSQALSEIKT